MHMTEKELSSILGDSVSLESDPAFEKVIRLCESRDLELKHREGAY